MTQDFGSIIGLARHNRFVVYGSVTCNLNETALRLTTLGPANALGEWFLIDGVSIRWQDTAAAGHTIGVVIYPEYPNSILYTDEWTTALQTEMHMLTFPEGVLLHRRDNTPLVAAFVASAAANDICRIGVWGRVINTAENIEYPDIQGVSVEGYKWPLQRRY